MWTLCDVPATELAVLRLLSLARRLPHLAAPVVEARQDYFAVGPAGL
jgi:hypothetical protein